MGFNSGFKGLKVIFTSTLPNRGTGYVESTSLLNFVVYSIALLCVVTIYVSGHNKNDNVVITTIIAPYFLDMTLWCQKQ